MITGENSINDIPIFIKCGLNLLGDSLIIGCDVLKNKNNISIRDYLEKYQGTIRFSIFDTFKAIISQILQDEKYSHIVN